MDERASVPVTLPRENPTQSYWQLDPDDIADLHSTESLPAEADTVIIGSGITGAAVAFNLLSSGARDVVMLEARQACSGATGRNGGHTKAASYLSFRHHQRAHGTAAARQIARLELANIRAVHAFARAHGIESACESRPCSTVDVVYDVDQWTANLAALAALRDAFAKEEKDGEDDDGGATYKVLTPDEVRERFFCGSSSSNNEKDGDGENGSEKENEKETENVYGGIEYEAGSINAYRFTIETLKLCLEKGLNLQTNTPVTKLEKREDGRWDVHTISSAAGGRGGGNIVAKRVVLATNGYTARLLPQFQGIIVPLRGHVTAQRPGSKMPKKGLGSTYSFVYKGGCYDYMIPRPKPDGEGEEAAGDIIIGGRLTSAEKDGLYEYGTTDDTTYDQNTINALRETLPNYFGDTWGHDHPDGRVRAHWTGIMGYGPDGLPFVGEMPGEQNKGLWVSASFQGHGMVLCWMCAKALVQMMLGNDGEDLRSWFPDAFRVKEERFARKFQGRMATRGDPAAGEE